MTKYKGKYPLRLNTICGARDKGTGKMVYRVRLNNGDWYQLNMTREYLESVNYNMPAIGTEIDLSKHTKIERVPARVEISESAWGPTRIPHKGLAELAQNPAIDEIENASMDERRFFVHLKKEWHWTLNDGHRTESFDSVSEARAALKTGIAPCPPACPYHNN